SLVLNTINRIVLLTSAVILFAACNEQQDVTRLKDEIYKTEKAFAKMCLEKSVEEAFYFFADDSAVILRGNDSLIVGKENIKKYYSREIYKTAYATWDPEFIDVSDCGTMAYTYGSYVWNFWKDNEDTLTYSGVF